MVLCSGVEVAHADIATSIYGDAKSIIGDLITDELSRQVIPRLVCHGRREPCRGAECGRPLEGFTVEIDGQRYLLSLLYHYQESLQRVFAHQYGSLRSAIRRESEDYAAFQIYETVNGLLYSPQDKITYQANLSGAFLVAVNAADVIVTKTPTETTLRAAFTGDALDECVKQVAANFRGNKFVATRSSPLDTVCAAYDSKSPDALAHSSLKCELALAFRSTLREEFDSAKGHMLRAVSTIVQVALKSNSTVAELTQRIPELALTLGELVRQEQLDPADAFATVIKMVVKLTGKEEKDWSDSETKISNALRTLTAVWRTITRSENKFDVATMLDQLASVDGAFNTLCTVDSISKTKLCSALAKMHAEIGRAAQYWPLINAAAHADYRQIAHQMIALLFRDVGEKECDAGNADYKNEYDAACKYVVYRRFADSLVTYFLDVATDGAPAEGSRAAFRNAAVDVLRDVAALGGMDRGPSAGRVLFMPDLELRAGYSPAFGMSEFSEVRTVAAARFVTVRPILRYTTHHYLAIHLSIIDLLAPFAEISKRPTTGIKYNSKGLAWNLISPSLEIAYGMPQLSKHLVVGIGATYRLVVPKLTRADDGTGSVVYEASHRDDFYELGAFVKYLL